jgi:hypothetical protein
MHPIRADPRGQARVRPDQQRPAAPGAQLPEPPRDGDPIGVSKMAIDHAKTAAHAAGQGLQAGDRVRRARGVGQKQKRG